MREIFTLSLWGAVELGEALYGLPSGLSVEGIWFFIHSSGDRKSNRPNCEWEIFTLAAVRDRTDTQ